MRRIILALTLALVSVLASGAIAPLMPRAHAQTSPTVTVTPSTVTTGSTATVQGTGFTPNSYVFVYWVRPNGTTGGAYDFTNASGSFTFTLGFSAANGTGFEYVTAYDYGTGRWAPFFRVTVTSPTSAPTLTAAQNPVTVGTNTTITGTGFTPNSNVYVQFRRPNGTMGSVYVFTDTTGRFTFTLGFLRTNGCGTETVQAYDFGTARWTAPYAITVTGC